MPSNIQAIAEQANRALSEVVAGLANATPEYLLTEIKTLRDWQKALKKLEGVHQNMLYARLDPPLSSETYAEYADRELRGVEGSEVSATIKHVVQARFDTKAFEKDHPDLKKKYTKITEFVQLKFNKEDADG